LKNSNEHFQAMDLDRQIIGDTPLIKIIWKIAWPAVVGFYLQAAYQFIDTIFVGRLGPASLAGISTGGFVVWGIFSLINIVSVGTQAIIARRIGEGNKAAAIETAYQGFLYSLVFSICISIPIVVFLPKIFIMMQTSPEVTAQGSTYLLWLVPGMPALCASFVLTAIMQAAGDTRTPTKIQFICLFFNALLAPALIFGWWKLPRLGIAGAALGTNISRYLFAILSIIAIERRQNGIHLFDSFRKTPDIAAWMHSSKIGLPPALTGALFALVYMMLTRITSHFGTPEVAALRVGHMAESFSFFAALGFGAATSAIVGQNLGAKKHERASRAAWTSAGMISVIALPISTVFFFLPSQISAIFSPDSEVIAACARYLFVLSFSQIFMCIELVLNGAFSGAGDTTPPMMILVPFTIARIPAAYLFTYTFNLGIVGVWWAISGSSIVKGVILALWFAKGSWKHKKI